MSSSKQFALLDADTLIYQATISSEFEADWGNGVHVLSSNLEAAKDHFNSAYRKVEETIFKLVGEMPVHLAFTDPERNFRHELVDDTYKSERTKTRKPLCWSDLREWVKEHHNVILKPGLEADDVLGLLATKPGNEGKVIMVSEDKDLKTIPGILIRGGEVIHTSPSEADLFWMTQTLTGDPVDGYKGCPGIGATKAEKLLNGTADMWRVVVGAFIKAGLTEADALRNARMARILRWSDWDQENQKVILWQPRKL